MTRKQAIELAKQRVKEHGVTQTIVQLRRPFYKRSSYIPIESRWVSGLDGMVVDEIK